MPTFLRDYGDTTDANGNPQVTSGTLSLLSSIVQVGELVGSLVAAIVGGYLGWSTTVHEYSQANDFLPFV